MFPAVTVTCFLLSYSLALLLELIRLVARFPGRHLVLLVMLGLGWIAHSLFLMNQLYADVVDSTRPHLLANWFEWIMLLAWGLATAYLILLIRNLQTAIGIFLVPLVLGLIVLGLSQRGGAPFTPETAIGLWRIIHGVSLLVGTMFICFGVAFGTMYLLQSKRLKSRRPASKFLRLPTLEFLQSMNRLSLFVSVVSLGLGMISGAAMNLNAVGGISWFSGGIIFTLALFVWSLVAAVMELTARSSLGGRRTAYLAIANFVFLIVVLAIMLFSSHGQAPATGASPRTEVSA